MHELSAQGNRRHEADAAQHRRASEASDDSAPGTCGVSRGDPSYSDEHMTTTGDRTLTTMHPDHGANKDYSLMLSHVAIDAEA